MNPLVCKVFPEINYEILLLRGTIDTFVYEGKDFRHTWEPKKNYRLTVEHRRQLCVHLAAHAAVSSMGDLHVYMLAVAPEGVRSWSMGDRKSNPGEAMWGRCSTSDIRVVGLPCDGTPNTLVSDRHEWERYCDVRYQGYLEFIKQMKERGPETSPKRSRDEYFEYCRHEVRACMCGYLAGHIADGISAGMEATEILPPYDRAETQHQYVGDSDISIAMFLADLLALGKDEYDHAARVTDEALRRPEVWAVVQRLASELERLGLIEDGPGEDDALALLPPPEKGWPPAPDQVDAW